MATFLIFLLAFCCVMPIQIANVAGDVDVELDNANLEMPSLNNTNGRTKEQHQHQDTAEINQFLNELSDQYSMIAMALHSSGKAKAIDYSMIETAIEWLNLNSNVDGLADGISKISFSTNDEEQKNESTILMDESEILKSIDQLDRSTADLLRKLHNSLSDLIDSVKGDNKNDGQNAKLQHLKTVIVEAVNELAKLWGISTNELVQMEKEREIDQQSMLKELAKFWHQFKRQNWQNEGQNSDEKRENDQQNRRMLKLIMDFSADGIDGLANLKGPKKSASRRRRRRKREDQSHETVAIVALIVVILGIILLCVCTQHKPTRSVIDQLLGRNKKVRQPAQTYANPAVRHDIENPSHIVPEAPERPMPRRTEQPPRSNSQSREALRANLDHSSSRGGNFQWDLDQAYYGGTAQPPSGQPDYNADEERGGRSRSRRGRSNSGNQNTPKRRERGRSANTRRNRPAQHQQPAENVPAPPAAEVHANASHGEGNSAQWQQYDPYAWDRAGTTGRHAFWGRSAGDEHDETASDHYYGAY